MKNKIFDLSEEQHDFKSPFPQLDDSQKRWIVLKYNRMNGRAGLALYERDEVSINNYERWQEDENYTVREYSDLELLQRMDEQADLEALETEEDMEGQ